MLISHRTKIFLLIFIIFVCVFIFYFVPKSKIKYESNVLLSSSNIDSSLTEEEILVETEPVVEHIETPESVKAIYLSGWTAGTSKYRDVLVKMIDNTELNSVVIDIKDSTGKISFSIDDPLIQEIGSSENRIKDITSLTKLLHEKNIYIIGRISVFQDPYLTSKKPEWAITRLSDGGIWKDKKGLSFLDPSKKEVRDYVITIAKKSYDLGFDEINFDYIRYPSDGNMKDINYHLTEGETRSSNLEDFFKYLNSEIKKEKDIPISGDLFGLTTEASDDMGIGQVWEKAILYFDFVCPMVYPSHYPSGHMGYNNPSMYPYEVINQALKSGSSRAVAIGQNSSKIRPWLQDFDLGTIYTKDLIRSEIQAVYDNGLTSWMLWDPSNKYTPSALLTEGI